MEPIDYQSGPREGVPERKVSAEQTFRTGLIAGSIQKLATYPLEVKIVSSNVMDQTALKMQELMRGLLFSLSLSAVKNGCCMLLNRNVKMLFPDDSRLSPFVGGAASGAFEVLWNPFNVIKQELQTGRSRSVSEAVLQRQSDSYGNGWKAMLGRNTINQAVLYGIYSLNSTSEDPLLVKMMKGGASGAFATIISWPWEFVRGQQAKERTRNTNSGFRILEATFREEGIRRIYRGCMLALVKQFIQAAILAPFISYALCNESSKTYWPSSRKQPQANSKVGP